MMQDSDQSKLYHKGKKLVFFLGLILDFIFLAAFFVTGFSLFLRQWAQGFSSYPLVFRAVYMAVFCLIFYAIHGPLNYFVGFRWEHRFKLSNQKFGAWFADEIKKSLLSFIIMLVFVEILYVILGTFPRHWWILASGVWLFISLFLAQIMPHVIIPIFYKYSQIDDADLKERIFSLFKKCRVTLKDVYAINFSAKTKKANAFVCGLGSQRRVVLGDTLIEDFTKEEIGAVVAHELGHYVAKDILKLIVVNTALIFLGFFLIDKVLAIVLARSGGLTINDIAVFPVFALALMVFGFLVTPLLNAFSCYLETQADRFSLTLTEDPQSFIGMMSKLGQKNLAEMNPSRFDEIMFYDHPPIAKRIKLAKNYMQKK